MKSFFISFYDAYKKYQLLQRKYHLKILFSLATLIGGLTVFTIYGEALPTNNNFIPEQWKEILALPLINTSLNVVMSFLGLSMLSDVNKIILLLLLTTLVLALLLLIFFPFYVVAPFLAFIAFLLNSAYRNYRRGQDLLLHIPLLNLDFYRAWSQEEMLGFIEQALALTHTSLDSSGKEKLLKEILESGLILKEEIIGRAGELLKMRQSLLEMPLEEASAADWGGAFTNLGVRLSQTCIESIYWMGHHPWITLGVALSSIGLFVALVLSISNRQIVIHTAEVLAKQDDANVAIVNTLSSLGKEGEVTRKTLEEVQRRVINEIITNKALHDAIEEVKAENDAQWAKFLAFYDVYEEQIKKIVYELVQDDERIKALVEFINHGTGAVSLIDKHKK